MSKIIWNDPDPIEGNDYTVQKIWVQGGGDTALIHYGEYSEDGMYSEAEVFIDELEVV